MTVLTDFSQKVPYPKRFFIGGEWVEPSSDAVVNVISPSTEELFLQMAKAAPADMDRAINAARQAFDNGPWPRMSPAERANHVRRLGQELAARNDDLCGVWSGEVGPTFSLNQHIMPMFTGIYEYYADIADDFPFIEAHDPESGGAGYLVREPAGVVGAIVPWNAPIMLASWKLAPALLAGCTIVLKAAPEAPGTLYMLAEAATAARLPKGVLNVITADRDVSELLVTDKRVDKISFTGSTAAGKRIASLCGERIARCTLELGGKSPAIVLDDYDIDKFAQSIVGSSILLTGQVCASLTRVIVSRSRQDDLLDAVKTRFEQIKVGDPFDPTTQMGPIAMERQRDRVESYIAKGRSEGAQLVTGGARPAHLNRGFYLEPTLFGNVDNSTTIAREEIFGPVISVIPVANDREAVAVANDSDYGLNASVFTEDSDRAFAIARALRSGTVSQNGFRPEHKIGFGGFKQSGIGREGGRDGLLPYLENKTVVIDKPISNIETVVSEGW